MLPRLGNSRFDRVVASRVPPKATEAKNREHDRKEGGNGVSPPNVDEKQDAEHQTETQEEPSTFHTEDSGGTCMNITSMGKKWSPIPPTSDYHER